MAEIGKQKDKTRKPEALCQRLIEALNTEPPDMVFKQ